MAPGVTPGIALSRCGLGKLVRPAQFDSTLLIPQCWRKIATTRTNGWKPLGATLLLAEV